MELRCPKCGGKELAYGGNTIHSSCAVTGEVSFWCLFCNTTFATLWKMVDYVKEGQE